MKPCSLKTTIIPRTTDNWQRASWQKILAEAITDPMELIQLLQLDTQLIKSAIAASKTFALRVPRSYVNRMQIGNPDDPLLKQVLPIADELIVQPGYFQDPLNEQEANPLPGLLHKYKSRVLMIVTGACSINCRYCFRRHFPYSENNPGRTGWRAAINYIAQDSSIHEVIFSGGDPLLAPDHYLAELTQQIAAIPHVNTLRIHTRLPITIPERITNEFITWFTGTRLQPVLVTHVNHAQELDNSVAEAIQKLRGTQITLLNQSVLLSGINDNLDALVNLCQRLFSIGILPYYLHQLDAVQGAAHFYVAEDQAKQLITELRHNLPGYLVPKFVREDAGAKAKTLIAF